MSSPIKSLIPANGLTTLEKDFQPGRRRIPLLPARRFDPENPELVDRPGVDRAAIVQELRTLEKFNRRLGGHHLALYYVKRFVERTNPSSLMILDLGTGVADIPRVIAAWAKQRKLPLHITAVDGNADILDSARESCRDFPEISFAQHDLRHLPRWENGFDLVLCSLTLHHFGKSEAVNILRNIRSMSRGGYVVNDLRRNWPAIWSTELFGRALMRNTAFRNDAIQSCRAAFTPAELAEMAELAGLEHFEIRLHHGFFRMVLEGGK